MKKIAYALLLAPLLFACSTSPTNAGENDLGAFFDHLGDSYFTVETLEDQSTFSRQYRQRSFFGSEGNLSYSYRVQEGKQETVSTNGMIKIPEYGYFTFNLAKDGAPDLEGELNVDYLLTPKQDLKWHEQRASFSALKSFFDEKEAFKAAFSPKAGEDRVYTITNFAPYYSSFRYLAEVQGDSIGEVYDATLRIEEGGGKGTFSISHKSTSYDWGGYPEVSYSTLEVSFFDFGKGAIHQFEDYLSSSSRPTAPKSWKEDKRLDKLKDCEGLSDALPFYDGFTYGNLSVIGGANSSETIHIMDLLLKQEDVDAYASLLLEDGWQLMDSQGGSKYAEDVRYSKGNFVAVLSFPTVCMESDLLEEEFLKDGYFSLYVSPKVGIFAE